MKPGTQLGEFTIVRPLASGGMGSVHLATNPAGERVAIKTVDSSSAAHLVSLRREIRALLAIDHPSIVRIVGHGLYEAIPWFAMEYIEGYPLRDHFTSSYETRLLHEGSDTLVHAPTLVAEPSQEPLLAWNQKVLPPDEQRTLLLQMARVLRGLGHLHAAGLVHRDLKPENIVVRQRDQEPVIVDFGIATSSAAGARERLSRVVSVAGTPAYMSPEQSLGRWSDARADLYSIGCMLYEILCGRPPFVADSFVKYAAAHAYQPPPPLPARVSKPLADLVARLLAKAPEERPGYAHDVAADIERILGATASKETPPTYLYRPDLVGRDEAMAACRDAITQLRTGKAGLTIIAGARGSGKTRLAIELASEVEGFSDMACVLVSNNPGEEQARGQNPFTAVLADIADRCRERGPEFTKVAFAGQVAVLAKVYPPLTELPGLEDLKIGPDLPVMAETMRRTKAFMELMQRVFPGKPVALILDEFAPKYLHYVQVQRSVQNTSPSPLWLFMTVNSDHENVMREVTKHQIVNLSPLSHNETHRLVRGSLGLTDAPADLVDFLFARSAGNPAMTMELLRQAVDLGYVKRDVQGQWVISQRAEHWEMPESSDAGRLMIRRLETLSQESQFLIRTLAIVGHPISVPLAERLMGGAGALDASLAPLIQMGAAEMGAYDVRLGANQLQAALLQHAAREDVRLAHSRLARALRDETAPDWGSIARHHHHADELDLAREAYLRAAKAAEARGDIEKRWLNLRGYLETKPRISEDVFDAYLGFATLSQRLAKTQDLRAVVEDALSAAQAANRVDVRARILAIKGAQLAISDVASALAILDEALQIAESLDHSEIRYRVLISFGHALQINGRGHEAEPYLRQARELAVNFDSHMQAQAAMNHAASFLNADRFTDAQEALQAALELSRSGDHKVLEGYVLGNLGILQREYFEDFPKALTLIREAILMHEACFDVPATAQATIYESGTLWRMGRYEEALAVAERAIQLNILAETGDGALLKARTVLAMALQSNGRFEEARTVFWEGRGNSPRLIEQREHALQAAAFERRMGNLDACEEWLSWNGVGQHKTAPDDDPRLMAARAHLALARGQTPEWPPRHDVSHTHYARAVQRALDASKLWYGEAIEDVIAIIPSMANRINDTD
ncbi:MAG: protein kinase [bacterium]